MAEYIDRAKIGLNDFEIIMCDGDYKEALKMLLQKIEDIPSADVQPVKHGKWVFNKPPDDWIMSLYTCDQCGHLEEGKPNYCSHCGAKMDGEE